MYIINTKSWLRSCLFISPLNMKSVTVHYCCYFLHWNPFKIPTLKVTTILYSLCTYFHSALFTLSHSIETSLGRRFFFTHCWKRISDFKICNLLEENLNSQWHEFKIQYICCKFLCCLQINSYSLYFYLLKTYQLPKL